MKYKKSWEKSWGFFVKKARYIVLGERDGELLSFFRQHHKQGCWFWSGVLRRFLRSQSIRGKYLLGPSWCRCLRYLFRYRWWAFWDSFQRILWNHRCRFQSSHDRTFSVQMSLVRWIWMPDRPKIQPLRIAF